MGRSEADLGFRVEHAIMYNSYLSGISMEVEHGYQDEENPFRRIPISAVRTNCRESHGSTTPR